VVLQSRQLAANDNQSHHGLGGEATLLAMMRLLRCGITRRTADEEELGESIVNDKFIGAKEIKTETGVRYVQYHGLATLDNAEVPC